MTNALAVHAIPLSDVGSNLYPIMSSNRACGTPGNYTFFISAAFPGRSNYVIGNGTYQWLVGWVGQGFREDGHAVRSSVWVH